MKLDIVEEESMMLIETYTILSLKRSLESTSFEVNGLSLTRVLLWSILSLLCLFLATHQHTHTIFTPIYLLFSCSFSIFFYYQPAASLSAKVVYLNTLLILNRSHVAYFYKLFYSCSS